MPWDADTRAKWKSALPYLAHDAVATLRSQHAVLGRANGEEIRAAGIAAFAAAVARDPTLRMPPMWNWSYKHWGAGVIRLFKRTVNEENAARVLMQCGLKVPKMPKRAPTRFKDTLTPDHPGYEMFENVFAYGECDQMLRAQESIAKWEHVFNAIDGDPNGKGAGGRATTTWGNKRARTDATDASASHSNRASGVVLSAFRQQGRIDDQSVEKLIKERLTPLLPDGAVFSPEGSVAYMIRNVTTGIPKSASRVEQPVHYDFARGFHRLSVLIALEHHVYLAVGDRWSKDWATIKKRIPITKGSVIVFSNTVPHAGMGDVDIDGCRRIRLYIGFGCMQRDVHPAAYAGGKLTYLACEEPLSRVD